MSLLIDVPAKYNAYKKIGVIAQGSQANHGFFINGFTKTWGWGINSGIQLGDNTNISRFSPVLIALYGINKTFCKISAGINYSLAIDKNGRAWGWGNGGGGQIGDNTLVNKCYPVLVQGAVKTFCQISANNFSLAIDKNGRLWAWGSNTTGQLGDNSTTSKLTPVSVLGSVKTFCQISGGSNLSLAIDKNGRAWAWGLNTSGQLGDNSTTSKLTPVSVLGSVKTFCRISAGSSLSLAIDKNGRVWSWGSNTLAQLGNSIISKIIPVEVLGAIKTFCQISVGDAHSFAIDKNGRAWGWGSNGTGRLGDNSIVNAATPVSIKGGVKTFCLISAGVVHSLALDKYGRAWGWGSAFGGAIGDNNAATSRLTPVSVRGAVKTFCKISAGNTNSFTIDKNGRAWAWGDNTYGRLGDGTLISRLTPVSVGGQIKTFCEIASGRDHTMALDKYGRAWGWGFNSNGRIGDNTVVSRTTPVSVLGTVKTFCQISAGIEHTMAIDKNGRAWGWGLYQYIGAGFVAFSYTPIKIDGATKTFCQISVGDRFSTAIDKNGRAWAWGNNLGGNLGINSITSQNSPVSVLGTVRTFCKITAGGTSGTFFTLALDKYGRAWGWGYNGVGQLGINSVTSQRTPVSVLGGVKTFCEISNGCNQAFSLAIDKNGRVWSWGVNGNGQLGDGTSISKLTPVSVIGAVKTFCKVSVGGFHSLAIDKNGRLWAWGNNSDGQLGTNTSGTTSVATPVSVLGTVKTFCHIAGGNSQSNAIDKNGQAWGWGFNGSGQNGDGGASNNLTPVSVLGQKKTFCKIASGNGVTLSIDNYGRLWAWGFNGNAQIGDNSNIPKRTPTRVCQNRTFCEVKGANSHVLAIEKNGQVWAWGSNNFGHLAKPYIANLLTPVSVAGAIKTFCKINAQTTFTLALDKNGKIWSWGRNNLGQLGINSTDDYIITPRSIYGNKTFCDIKNKAAGHSIAIDYQGKAWAWGSNSSGQLGTNNYFVSVLTPVRVCVI